MIRLNVMELLKKQEISKYKLYNKLNTIRSTKRRAINELH